MLKFGYFPLTNAKVLRNTRALKIYAFHKKKFSHGSANLWYHQLYGSRFIQGTFEYQSSYSKSCEKKLKFVLSRTKDQGNYFYPRLSSKKSKKAKVFYFSSTKAAEKGAYSIDTIQKARYFQKALAFKQLVCVMLKLAIYIKIEIKKS